MKRRGALAAVTLVGLVGVVSAAHAQAPLCWSLTVQPPVVGAGPTTLKLHASDMGGQFVLTGTARTSLTTFPPTNVVLLAVGTAAFLNGNVEASVRATGVSSSAPNGLETREYYLILNATTLDGSFIGAQSGSASLIACP